MCVCVHTRSRVGVCACVCMYVFMCACVCVCVCVCVYACVYTCIIIMSASVSAYHISRIIGEHFIWWFAKKQDFKLAVLSTVCRETHACR